MRETARLALLALVGLVFARPALAGEISLETTLKIDVGAAVKVTVTVRNRGNDTAHDVGPRLRFNDAVRTGPPVQQIAPTAKNEWVLEFPLPERPGRYPLLSTVVYTDPGFRGFSAVSSMTVDVGGVFPARLRGTVSKVSLGEGEATLTITVEADDAVERNVSVTAFLPDELGGLRDVGKVRTSRGQPRILTVQLQNYGGLPGSRYPVYAVLRSTDGEHDTAALLMGTVEVTSSVAMIDWQPYLPHVAVALAVLFVLVEITLRLRERWDGRATPPRRSDSPPARRQA
jgi:hypothetical protein